MGFLIIVGSIFLIGYYLSLKAYPLTKCKACDGRGKHEAAGRYGYAYRRCGRCGGTGRRDRLGVRLFLSRNQDRS